MAKKPPRNGIVKALLKAQSPRMYKNLYPKWLLYSGSFTLLKQKFRQVRKLPLDKLERMCYYNPVVISSMPFCLLLC
jgi:hypothetical protein